MNDYKFAPGILVPHHLKPSPDNAPRQLLTGMIAADGISEAYLDTDGIVDGFDDNSILSAADYIAEQTRQALWYPRKSTRQRINDYKEYDIENPIPLSELRVRQFAACIGFTLVASELMDMAGIDHWLSYTNMHTGILVPTDEGRKIQYIDPLIPDLGQNLIFSMVTDSDLVEADMKDHKKSIIEINTLTLAERSRRSSFDLFREHRWLNFPKTTIAPQNVDQGLYGSGRMVDPSGQEHLKYLAYMSVYKSTAGRLLFEQYAEMRQHYSRGEMMSAAQMLDQIGSDFPDVDARRMHPEINQILIDISRNGHSLMARRILAKHFASFILTGSDSRFPERYGDHLRAVGREGQDIEAARLAVVKYNEALAMDGPNTATLLAKREKAEAWVRRLEVAA